MNWDSFLKPSDISDTWAHILVNSEVISMNFSDF